MLRGFEGCETPEDERDRLRAEVARLRTLLHRVYNYALVFNEKRGRHECRRCGGPLVDSGVKHKPQCAWAAVEEALGIERGDGQAAAQTLDANDK